MQEHPLRTYRRQKLLSLHELAQAAGTTKANLSRIETGVQKPSFDLLKRLIDATGGDVTADEMLTACPNCECDRDPPREAATGAGAGA